MSSRGQVWIPAPQRNLNGQTVQFRGANPAKLLAALTTFACFACHVNDSFKERSPICKGRQPHPFPPCGRKLLTAGLTTTFHFLVHIVLLYVRLISRVCFRACLAGLTRTSTFLYCRVPPAPRDSCLPNSLLVILGWSALGERGSRVAMSECL